MTGTHGSGVTYVHHPTELIYGGSMDGPDPHYGEAGAYYDKLCNGVYMDTVWIPERTPRQTAEDLAGEAAEYVPYPKPTIGSSPAPGQDHLVRLRSFFWIDPAAWQPQTASASVPGITSTVVATPKRVVWSMGNGDQVVCDNPGTPYDPSLREESQVTDCSYVYPSSSAGQPNERFTVTARIEWEVTWSAPAVGIGAVPLPPGASANSTTVRVAEVQALNTTTA